MPYPESVLSLISTPWGGGVKVCTGKDGRTIFVIIGFWELWSLAQILFNIFFFLVKICAFSLAQNGNFN